MEIITLPGYSYASNTYVLKSSGSAAVIDPSASIERIEEAISGYRLRFILLTHGHFDHMMTLDALRAKYRVSLMVHEDDAEKIGDPALNASEFFGLEFAALPPDETFTDCDTIRLGADDIRVKSLPGHTSGSVCFEMGYDLICGDTLFEYGYGRFDLPSGDPKQLFGSLKKLAERRDDPIIYPGHGGSCRLSEAAFIRELRNFH